MRNNPQDCVWSAIETVPHPTYPDRIAYVVPLGDGRMFWLGVDLGHYERAAASKGVTLEEHVGSLVRHYFPAEERSPS